MSFELRLGDCLDPVTGLASLPDRSVDAVVTDPPYGQRTHDGQRHRRREGGPRYDGILSSAGLEYEHLTPEQVASIGAQFVRVAGGWVCVMTSHDLAPHWEAALGRYTFAPVPIVLQGMNVRLAGDGPSSWCIWLMVNRPRGLVDGTKPGAYVGPPSGNGQERAANPVKGHKPLWLMEKIIGDYTKPGDLICDPFAGSGTTGVAAIRLGRRFIGWERDPKYHAVAMKRLSGAREQLRMFEGGPAGPAPKPQPEPQPRKRGIAIVDGEGRPLV